MEYEDLVAWFSTARPPGRPALGSSPKMNTGLPSCALLPGSKAQAIRDEFFAGDVTDLALLAFIRALRRNCKVGLISNAWSGLRPSIVKREYDDAFDAMIISAEVGVAKPDPRIYQLALEKLGVAASESVFLDDFLENVAGDRAVGMQAIHFTQPEQALEELKQLLANHH